MDRLLEKRISGEDKYHGCIVKVELDQVELSNGKQAVREVVRHSGGVAVLALSEEGMVTVVDQYRYPFQEVMRELPAGKLDKGPAGEEDHLEAAKRELKEETGLVAGKYQYLGTMRVSPGFCDEVLHMYLAQDLRQELATPDEDEFVNVAQVPFDTLLEQVMSGELSDGKTVAAVLKTKVLLGL